MTRTQTVANRRNYLMLGFAFLATVINYLSRQTLSVMAPVLMAQFTISATGYSRVVFAFMMAYTIMNGISGRLLDRLGTKIGYALTIAFWSGAEMLHAFSAGVLSLGVFQFLLGIGEAGNYPAGVKLIAERFPVEERSFASGLFNSGASIGAILAPPLLAAIVLASGWRAAFVIIGILGFLWIAAWIKLYREPEAASAANQSEYIPLRALLRSRFLWQFTASKVFSDPVWYFYAFWFPQYLKIAHSFTLREIGQTAWIPFFTATLGNLAGGFIFTRVLRTGIAVVIVRRITVFIFSALMMSALFIGSGRSAPVCIALISVATFGYSGALANLLAVPGDVFTKGGVASIWGFASMGSGLGGMVFSLVTGWLIDHYSWHPVFTLFGILPVVAALLVWTLPKKIDTMRFLQTTPQ